MRKLFAALKEIIKSGGDAVLATVIASSGSAPRGAGASMLVAERGRVLGTIGGGAVEYQAEQRALSLLEEKVSRMEEYRLHPNEVQDLGMICGGEVSVYFRYMPGGDAALLALADTIEELFQRGEESWLIAELTPGREGALGVYGRKSGLFGTEVPPSLLEKLGSRAMRLSVEGRSYYFEPLVQAGRVYIFGGGHVSQALVPALAAVGFRCVVLEDREEFCREELFPGVEATRRIDIARIEESLRIAPEDYVAIMTRGHKDDQSLMAQVLRTPARYIGVMGSRRKAAGVAANLRKMGFSEEDLGRIITPIGLAIGAETPAEIAVSVAAQLIQVRAAL